MVQFKYRVHEVAKDFGVNSKVIMDYIAAVYPGTKNHMTTLTEDELDVVFEMCIRDSFSGEYGREIDRYLSDQFPGRDFFVEVKSRTERATGRREVNGVYFLKNGALAERFLPGDLTRAEANADAVRRFSEAVDVPVTFALIPAAGGVYSEELPYGAPQTDQRALTDALYTRYGGSTADLYSALRARRGEEIYFRTDHH